MRETRERLVLVVMAVVGLLSTGSAQAQTIVNLSAGGADKSYGGAAGSRAGLWLDQGAIGGTDSRRELIVGAPGGTAGRVYVLFGGPDHARGALDDRAELIITGPASFGTATAAGNVLTTEGTLPRDLVVAAPDAGADQQGIVYIFNGFLAGGRLTQANARLTITGAPGDRLGTSLATADLDNDGYREIIMGAPGNDRIYIVHGGASLASRELTAGADVVIQGHPTNNSGIGRSMVAGPLTSDGIYDLVIGEPDANMVYVIAGRDRVRLPARIDLPVGQTLPSTLPAGVTSAFAGVDVGDRAGATLRTSDLDGRNGLDLVIGAPNADGRGNNAPDAGEMYVVWNEQMTTSRSLGTSGVIFYGGQSNQRLGAIVANGDVNRDTPNDLVFALTYGSGGEERVYYGRERTEIGVASGATRVVDLSISGQEDRIIINDATTAPRTALAVIEVTGEGARDIVLSVADDNAGAGTVFLTISPKMDPSQRSATFNLREGETASSRIDVRNLSAIQLPWRVTVPAVSWLSVSPTGGVSHAAVTQNFEIRVDTATLGVGTHTTQVNLIADSRDLTMNIPIEVTVNVTQSRYLQVESPANGASLTQPFTVTGYAIDTRVPTGTGVDRVDVYAMPTTGGGRILLGTATYGEARPAVGSTHGSRFTNSGFTLTVNNAPGGTYRLVGEARTSGTSTVWTKLDGPVVTVRGLPPEIDLNRDGFVDILFQNTESGAAVYWSMSGLNMVAGGLIGPGTLPAGRWEIRSAADMNRDGGTDVILQEVETGQLLVWLLNGTALQEARALPTLSDPAWRVMAAADMNEDSNIDLVFQHLTQGYVVAWLMNGTTVSQGVPLTPNRVTDNTWQIIGAGDVSGDRRPDLIWQNTRTRVLTSWIMNGTTMTAGGPFTVAGPSDTNWQARGMVDINADGKVDMLWQDVSRGYIAAWLLDGRTFVDARLLNPGQVGTSWLLQGPR